MKKFSKLFIANNNLKTSTILEKKLSYLFKSLNLNKKLKTRKEFLSFLIFINTILKNNKLKKKFEKFSFKKIYFLFFKFFHKKLMNKVSFHSNPFKYNNLLYLNFFLSLNQKHTVSNYDNYLLFQKNGIITTLNSIKRRTKRQGPRFRKMLTYFNWKKRLISDYKKYFIWLFKWKRKRKLKFRKFELYYRKKKRIFYSRFRRKRKSATIPIGLYNFFRTRRNNKFSGFDSLALTKAATLHKVYRFHSANLNLRKKIFVLQQKKKFFLTLIKNYQKQVFKKSLFLKKFSSKTKKKLIKTRIELFNRIKFHIFMNNKKLTANIESLMKKKKKFKKHLKLALQRSRKEKFKKKIKKVFFTEKKLVKRKARKYGTIFNIAYRIKFLVLSLKNRKKIDFNEIYNLNKILHTYSRKLKQKKNYLRKTNNKIITNFLQINYKIFLLSKKNKYTNISTRTFYKNFCLKRFNLKKTTTLKNLINKYKNLNLNNKKKIILFKNKKKLKKIFFKINNKITKEKKFKKKFFKKLLKFGHRIALLFRKKKPKKKKNTKKKIF